MRRRLDRLFTFARAAENRPLENFTTEALANALELDPSPLLRTLPGELAAGIPPDRARVLRVETQVGIQGGTLDLVVDLSIDERPISLWIEVKAHAGMSGGQLETYILEAQQQPHPTHVLMLCKYPLTDKVPTLRWNVLRAWISDAPHEYWRDLRHFLEDHQMADDFDTPVTAAELKVAPDARALLRKVVRLSQEFLREKGGPGLPKVWFESKFPESEKKITAAISRQFANHGRLVVDSRRHPWTCFGLDFCDGPQLRIWVEIHPKRLDARDALFKLAEALPSPWKIERESPWPWFGAARTITGDLDHEDALQWLRERVLELDAAKILGVLKNWRLKGHVGDSDDGDDD